MLRKDTKVELLRKVPLFSECNRKELGAIATLADLIDVPAGMVLVKEGGLDREFIVLVDGAVEVRRGSRKIDTLGAGDFFGEIALVSGGPRTASVKTTAPSSILVVREGPFRSLVEEMPSIAVNVLRVLAERLRPLTV